LPAQLPDLRAAASAARRLAGLLRKESTGELATVLEEMAGTPLARFAEGLRRDAAAVQNALELPWTTSPVEGQVNRIKTLKRHVRPGRVRSAAPPCSPGCLIHSPAREVRESL